MAPILGKIIKRHRVLKDMSVKELAVKADISYGYCLEIERGSYDPSIKTLAKIAKALQTPLWVIIKEAEEEENANNKSD